MWGDNESQVHSAARPHAKLHKRHNILSFHFVRSILSQQYINLMHIKSEYNCSDLLTKHWGYNVVWKHICHTQIKRGSPIVDPTVEVQSRKTEVVLILV